MGLVIGGRRQKVASRKAVGKSAPKKAETRPGVQPLQTGMKSRKGWLDRVGWYESLDPAIETTTRQAEALRVSVSSSAGSERALLVGQDLDTGELMYSDPISDYAMADGPKSATRICLGAVGMGKSSFLKTNAVLRPLLLARRVAAVDKKYQADVGGGEYTKVCHALGVESLRFTTDGTGMRINALDPRIARSEGNNGSGQSGLLRAILREALGRPLTPREGKALRVAHAQAIGTAQNTHRVADIRDVVTALTRPDSTAAERTAVSVSELREWGLDARFELERCIEEDLVGLIDGPTDPRVKLNPTFTSFDISTLENETALRIVMAIISTWFSHTFITQKMVVPTHFVVEEGWHLAAGSFAEVIRSNIKLSRGMALANEFAFHHLSDIPSDTAAMSMIKEAGHAAFYHQDKDEDAAAIVREFSLPGDSGETLKNLQPGMCLYWQSGRPIRLVQHLRSDEEQKVTDTDSAMTSRATTFDLIEQIEELEQQESAA